MYSQFPAVHCKKESVIRLSHNYGEGRALMIDVGAQVLSEIHGLARLPESALERLAKAVRRPTGAEKSWLNGARMPTTCVS